MSWNTWGSSNLPSENQKKRKNNPHVGVLVKRLFCVQTEEDYYYYYFFKVKNFALSSAVHLAQLNTWNSA